MKKSASKSAVILSVLALAGIAAPGCKGNRGDEGDSDGSTDADGDGGALWTRDAILQTLPTDQTGKPRADPCTIGAVELE